MDFQQLNNQLKSYYSSILADVCPGGKTHGKEYKSGNIFGGPGTSFSFNLESGAWADFATNDRGHDVISLYSKIKNINNGEAAKELSKIYLNKSVNALISYPVQHQKQISIIKPPKNTAMPNAVMANGQSPSKIYTYRDVDSDPLFYILRYDLPDGSKVFNPLTFESSGKWVRKAWPDSRPLYNLDLIVNNPDKPILICEGEKAADAAQELLGHIYVATTWPNGAQSLNKVNLSPLYNRKILLWPDADEAGVKCMSLLASNLVGKSSEIKIINTDKSDGWDAHDALAEGMDSKSFIKWARPLVQDLTPRVKENEATISNYESSEMSKVTPQMLPILKSFGCELNYKQDSVLLTQANVVKVLQNHPKFKGKIKFDTFYQRKFTTLYSDSSEEWADHHDLNLLFTFQSELCFSKLAKQTIIDAVETVAHFNKCNEPQDYFKSLNWDNVPRIDEFFITAMGAEDSEYTRAVSKNMFIAIAARVLNPGCKFDNMVILEGEQGTYKSTSLAILGGKWFSEAPSTLDSKDFEQSLVGKIIIEFDELDQFRKSEDTLIKKKLSTSVDNYRPSYGRNTVSVPRTSIFVGTTNKDTYLKDETGSRRFWPVSVKSCDIDYIKENREQLFAEAVFRFNKGESFHEVPSSIKEIHAQRYEIPAYTEAILDWLNRDAYPRSTLRLNEVWTDALLGDISRFDLRAQREVGKALKYLGFKKTDKRVDGLVVKIWTKDFLFSEKPPETPKKIKNYAPGAEN